MDEQTRILRPSAAHRWLNCPASVLYPPGPSSAYANEGKAAHALAQWAFENGTKAVDYDRDPIQYEHDDPAALWPFTMEMADKVDKYVSKVREYANGHHIMAELPLEICAPGEKGTADAVVYVFGVEVQVHDLKYGHRPVSAQSNEQLMLYADAVLSQLELVYTTLPDNVRLVIHQPNLDRVDDWATTRAELDDFVKTAMQKAAKCIQIYAEGTAADADFSPGEKQCHWCSHKAECPALRRQVLQTVSDDFVDESAAMPDPKVISGAPDRIANTSADLLGSVYAQLPLIRQFCDAVEERVRAELHAGNCVPGYKLVAGRAGHRKWADEKAVLKKMKAHRFLNKEIYEQKLVSPAKFEKVAGDKFAKYAKFIEQGQSSPSVVPESDKRPALVQVAAAEEFELITDAQNCAGKDSQNG